MWRCRCAMLLAEWRQLAVVGSGGGVFREEATTHANKAATEVTEATLH